MSMVCPGSMKSSLMSGRRLASDPSAVVVTGAAALLARAIAAHWASVRLPGSVPVFKLRHYPPSGNSRPPVSHLEVDQVLDELDAAVAAERQEQRLHRGLL